MYKIEKGKQKSVYKRGEKRKRIAYKKEEGKQDKIYRTREKIGIKQRMERGRETRGERKRREIKRAKRENGDMQMRWQ